jgi:hypothetical protein
LCLLAQIELIRIATIHPLCIPYIFIFSFGLMASAIEEYSYVLTTIRFEKTICFMASAAG